MKQFMHFKTLFRLTVLTYWATVIFVSKWALIALFVYLLFYRLILVMTDDKSHHEWKMLGYGKSDSKFTIRKLFYMIKTAKKLQMRDAYIRNDDNGNFKKGGISLDPHLEIRLESRGSKFQVHLLFNGQVIDTFKGYAFKSIQWNLDEAPELKKVVTKFLANIEDEFEQTLKQNTKIKQKTEQKQQNLAEEKRKELLKEARQVYKKDMSI